MTTEEANRSRRVTRIRNLNERAFGRLVAMWGFLRRKLPSSLLRHFVHAYRLLLAVDNAFMERLWTSTDLDESDLKVLDSRSSMISNPVKDISNLSDWKECAVKVVVDALPGDLDNDGLRRFNTGPYAIRLAPRYIEHLDDEKIRWRRRNVGDQTYFKITNIVSRHSKGSVKRTVTLTFGGDALATQVYCTCPAGMRTIGTCAHGTAVLYSLIKGRHGDPKPVVPPKVKRKARSSPFKEYVTEFTLWSRQRRKEKKGRIAINARVNTVRAAQSPEEAEDNPLAEAPAEAVVVQVDQREKDEEGEEVLAEIVADSDEESDEEQGGDEEEEEDENEHLYSPPDLFDH